MKIIYIRKLCFPKWIYTLEDLKPHLGILMKDDFQKLFTHEIPIQKKIKTGRISFTFRKHLV
jgi:hypothetical protein